MESSAKDLEGSGNEMKEKMPLYSKGLLGPGQFFNDEKNEVLKTKRWGFWSTMGFAAIICTLYFFIAGLLVGFIYGFNLASNPELDQDVYFESLLNSGYFLSLSTLVTTWLTVGLIILFVALRKGITISEYLDFTPVSLKVVLRWLGVTLLFMLLWDASYPLFDIMEPDFEEKIYRTAGNPILLWIAVVIAAPLSEEFFFRGFLFEGIRGSKLGPVGAILITSVTWGAIHLQYGIYEMVLIGVFGVLLGIAKIKTRSIYTSMTLHCFFNLMAMVELAAVN